MESLHMSPSIRKACDSLLKDISELEQRLSKALDGMRRLAHSLQGNKDAAADLALLKDRLIPAAQGAMLAANGFGVQLRETR
jgi:hypothetical protein